MSHAIADYDQDPESPDGMDPELRSVLLAEGVETVEAAHARGRAYWVELFADRAGFRRDFTELLEQLGLTWETAAEAERFQCPVYEMEIGVPAAATLQKLGIETFADAFRHPEAEIRDAMAARDGMLVELEALLGRCGLAW